MRRWLSVVPHRGLPDKTGLGQRGSWGSPSRYKKPTRKFFISLSLLQLTPFTYPLQRRYARFVPSPRPATEVLIILRVVRVPRLATATVVMTNAQAVASSMLPDFFVLCMKYADPTQQLKSQAGSCACGRLIAARVGYRRTHVFYVLENP